jgi:hypothetical protein
MSTNEFSITCAIQALQDTPTATKKGTAIAYNISRTTLRDRFTGKRQPREIAHQHRQRLSPPQETFLGDWILDEESRGYPPSHPRIRDMAARVLRMNGDERPLGKRWTDGFLRRNPRIASIIGRKIHANRVDNASPDNL